MAMTPAAYWPILAGMLATHIVFTQIVKMWFIRRFGEVKPKLCRKALPIPSRECAT
jgi:hypothetical protein